MGMGHPQIDWTGWMIAWVLRKIEKRYYPLRLFTHCHGCAMHNLSGLPYFHLFHLRHDLYSLSLNYNNGSVPFTSSATDRSDYFRTNYRSHLDLRSVTIAECQQSYEP